MMIGVCGNKIEALFHTYLYDDSKKCLLLVLVRIHAQFPKEMPCLQVMAGFKLRRSNNLLKVFRSGFWFAGINELLCNQEGRPRLQS